MAQKPMGGKDCTEDLQDYLARMEKQLAEIEAQHQQTQYPTRENLARATWRYLGRNLSQTSQEGPVYAIQAQAAPPAYTAEVANGLTATAPRSNGRVAARTPTRSPRPAPLTPDPAPAGRQVVKRAHVAKARSFSPSQVDSYGWQAPTYGNSTNHTPHIENGMDGAAADVCFAQPGQKQGQGNHSPTLHHATHAALLRTISEGSPMASVHALEAGANPRSSLAPPLVSLNTWCRDQPTSSPAPSTQNPTHLPPRSRSTFRQIPDDFCDPIAAPQGGVSNWQHTYAHSQIMSYRDTSAQQGPQLDVGLALLQRAESPMPAIADRSSSASHVQHGKVTVIQLSCTGEGSESVLQGSVQLGSDYRPSNQPSPTLDDSSDEAADTGPLNVAPDCPSSDEDRASEKEYSMQRSHSNLPVDLLQSRIPDSVPALHSAAPGWAAVAGAVATSHIAALDLAGGVAVAALPAMQSPRAQTPGHSPHGVRLMSDGGWGANAAVGQQPQGRCVPAMVTPNSGRSGKTRRCSTSALDDVSLMKLTQVLNSTSSSASTPRSCGRPRSRRSRDMAQVVLHPRRQSWHGVPADPAHTPASEVGRSGSGDGAPTSDGTSTPPLRRRGAATTPHHQGTVAAAAAVVIGHVAEEDGAAGYQLRWDDQVMVAAAGVGGTALASAGPGSLTTEDSVLLGSPVRGMLASGMLTPILSSMHMHNEGSSKATALAAATAAAAVAGLSRSGTPQLGGADSVVALLEVESAGDADVSRQTGGSESGSESGGDRTDERAASAGIREGFALSSVFPPFSQDSETLHAEGQGESPGLMSGTSFAVQRHIYMNDGTGAGRQETGDETRGEGEVQSRAVTLADVYVEVSSTGMDVGRPVAEWAPHVAMWDELVGGVTDRLERPAWDAGQLLRFAPGHPGDGNNANVDQGETSGRADRQTERVGTGAAALTKAIAAGRQEERPMSPGNRAQHGAGSFTVQESSSDMESSSEEQEGGELPARNYAEEGQDQLFGWGPTSDGPITPVTAALSPARLAVLAAAAHGASGGSGLGRGGEEGPVSSDGSAASSPSRVAWSRVVQRLGQAFTCATRRGVATASMDFGATTPGSPLRGPAAPVDGEAAGPASASGAPTALAIGPLAAAVPTGRQAGDPRRAFGAKLAAGGSPASVGRQPGAGRAPQGAAGPSNIGTDVVGGVDQPARRGDGGASGSQWAGPAHRRLWPGSRQGETQAWSLSEEEEEEQGDDQAAGGRAHGRRPAGLQAALQEGEDAEGEGYGWQWAQEAGTGGRDGGPAPDARPQRISEWGSESQPSSPPVATPVPGTEVHPAAEGSLGTWFGQAGGLHDARLEPRLTQQQPSAAGSAAGHGTAAAAATGLAIAVGIAAAAAATGSMLDGHKGGDDAGASDDGSCNIAGLISLPSSRPADGGKASPVDRDSEREMGVGGAGGFETGRGLGFWAKPSSELSAGEEHSENGDSSSKAGAEQPDGAPGDSSLPKDWLLPLPPRQPSTHAPSFPAHGFATQTEMQGAVHDSADGVAKQGVSTASATFDDSPTGFAQEACVSGAGGTLCSSKSNSSGWDGGRVSAVASGSVTAISDSADSFPASATEAPHDALSGVGSKGVRMGDASGPGPGDAEAVKNANAAGARGTNADAAACGAARALQLLKLRRQRRAAAQAAVVDAALAAASVARSSADTSLGSGASAGASRASSCSPPGQARQPFAGEAAEKDAAAPTVAVTSVAAKAVQGVIWEEVMDESGEARELAGRDVRLGSGLVTDEDLRQGEPRASRTYTRQYGGMDGGVYSAGQAQQGWSAAMPDEQYGRHDKQVEPQQGDATVSGGDGVVDAAAAHVRQRWRQGPQEGSILPNVDDEQYATSDSHRGYASESFAQASSLVTSDGEAVGSFATSAAAAAGLSMSITLSGASDRGHAYDAHAYQSHWHRGLDTIATSQEDSSGSGSASGGSNGPGGVGEEANGPLRHSGSSRASSSRAGSDGMNSREWRAAAAAAAGARTSDFSRIEGNPRAGVGVGGGGWSNTVPGLPRAEGQARVWMGVEVQGSTGQDPVGGGHYGNLFHNVGLGARFDPNVSAWRSALDPAVDGAGAASGIGSTSATQVGRAGAGPAFVPGALRRTATSGIAAGVAAAAVAGKAEVHVSTVAAGSRDSMLDSPFSHMGFAAGPGSSGDAEGGNEGDNKGDISLRPSLQEVRSISLRYMAYEPTAHPAALGPSSLGRQASFAQGQANGIGEGRAPPAGGAALSSRPSFHRSPADDVDEDGSYSRQPPGGTGVDDKGKGGMAKEGGFSGRWPQRMEQGGIGDGADSARTAASGVVPMQRAGSAGMQSAWAEPQRHAWAAAAGSMGSGRSSADGSGQGVFPVSAQGAGPHAFATTTASGESAVSSSLGGADSPDSQSAAMGEYSVGAQQGRDVWLDRLQNEPVSDSGRYGYAAGAGVVAQAKAYRDLLPGMGGESPGLRFCDRHDASWGRRQSVPSNGGNRGRSAGRAEQGEAGDSGSGSLSRWQALQRLKSEIARRHEEARASYAAQEGAGSAMEEVDDAPTRLASPPQPRPYLRRKSQSVSARGRRDWSSVAPRTQSRLDSRYVPAPLPPGDAAAAAHVVATRVKKTRAADAWKRAGGAAGGLRRAEPSPPAVGATTAASGDRGAAAAGRAAQRKAPLDGGLPRSQQDVRPQGDGRGGRGSRGAGPGPSVDPGTRLQRAATKLVQPVAAGDSSRGGGRQSDKGEGTLRRAVSAVGGCAPEARARGPQRVAGGRPIARPGPDNVSAFPNIDANNSPLDDILQHVNHLIQEFDSMFKR